MGILTYEGPMVMQRADRESMDDDYLESSHVIMKVMIGEVAVCGLENTFLAIKSHCCEPPSGRGVDAHLGPVFLFHCSPALAITRIV